LGNADAKPITPTNRYTFMPIFYTSYPDNKITKAINDLVGKPYSLWDNLKMGGTGCQSMLVKEVSVGLQQYINDPLYPSYSAIELRPGGILVSLSHIMQRYTWPIPYAQLQITHVEVTQNARNPIGFKKINSIIITINDHEHTLVLEDVRGANRKFLTKLQEQISDLNIG
jgi:hypothetical protein